MVAFGALYVLYLFSEKDQSTGDQKYRRMTERHYKRTTPCSTQNCRSREREKPNAAPITTNHCSDAVYLNGPSIDESVYQTPPSTSVSPPQRTHHQHTQAANSTQVALAGKLPHKCQSPSRIDHDDEKPTLENAVANLTLETLCSECHGEGRGRGVWYKCTTCTELILCSECENRGLHDHHVMIRISSAASPVPQMNNSNSIETTQNYNRVFRR